MSTLSTIGKQQTEVEKLSTEFGKKSLMTKVSSKVTPLFMIEST